MDVRFLVRTNTQVLVCVYTILNNGVLYLKGVEESEIFEGEAGVDPVLIPSTGRNFPSLLMTFRETNSEVLKDLTIL